MQIHKKQINTEGYKLIADNKQSIFSADNTVDKKMPRINPWRKFNVTCIPEQITKIPVTQLSHGSKICYGRLARYAGKNGLCYPSIKSLAKEIGVGKRSVDKYIKELKDFGLIETKRMGLNKPNLYYFLDHEVLQQTLQLDEQTDVSEDVHIDQTNTHDDVYKESHINESQSKESTSVYKPKGSHVSLFNMDLNLVPFSKEDTAEETGTNLQSFAEDNELGSKDKIEQEIKEIVFEYRQKVSKGYKPQLTSETPGLIKFALKSFSKDEIFEAIKRYSQDSYWRQTFKHGINWFFKYNFDLNEPYYIEDFLHLDTKIYDLR